MVAELGWNRDRVRVTAGLPHEYNPVEAMWSHAKHAKLVENVRDAVGDLGDAVTASLDDQARDRQLKLSFLKTAQLRM